MVDAQNATIGFRTLNGRRGKFILHLPLTVEIDTVEQALRAVNGVRAASLDNEAIHADMFIVTLANDAKWGPVKTEIFTILKRFTSPQ